MILHSPTANTWTLRLLLTQLYDPAMEVCELATQFLEEACESVDILQLVVAMQPTLDHLGDAGFRLLGAVTAAEQRAGQRGQRVAGTLGAGAGGKIGIGRSLEPDGLDELPRPLRLCDPGEDR